MTKLAANGGNWMRVWMCSWAFAIEWQDTGMGNYDKRQGRAFQVELAIYNLDDEYVRNFTRLEKSPGSYSIDWGGKNDECLLMPSGIYFYRLKLDNRLMDTKRMILIK